MSLWCGSCRREIFEGFGLLYQLERMGDGQLRFPDQAKDYVPANSAVCDPCWNSLPINEMVTDEKVRAEMERGKETVFAYTSADSNNDPVWKSKTWSSIVANDSNIVFIKHKAVVRYFPKAVEIIENMAKSRLV